MILTLPWISMLGAFLMLFIPKENEKALKTLTFLCCAVSSLIVLVLTLQFDPSAPGYQFHHRFEWLPALGITYQVGLDGINLVMCILHALVSLSGAFVACYDKERLKEYLLFYLILTGAIYGVFTSLDMFFLYLFYETTLIPLFPMIGIWGGKNKDYGAMKLNIFITGGAVLALVGLLALYHGLGANSFDLITMTEHAARNPLPDSLQMWIAPLLLVGFGVIASLWPFHSWSPIGYAAAPTAVSMLHAGVLKKMGPYLIIRLAIVFVPEGVKAWSSWLALLACIGIIYAGYAAIRQRDLKYIVGFSSVSHMGYVLLGIAALNLVSLSGAVLLIFSHGVMAACTFGLIGYVYEQTHARDVNDYGGLSHKAPFWSIAFIMASMASLGLPGFSNFASELLIFIGAWQQYPLIVAFAVFGVLITAIYLLRTVQKMCYGPANPKWPELRDASTFAERFPFLLLLGALLLFGLWPQGLLRYIQPAIGGILP